MKRIVVLWGVMALVGLSGCATKEYVHTQVKPLAERLDKLEAAAKAGSLNDAEQATAIKQADDKAQLALDTANKASQDAQKAEAAAASAAQSANEAAMSAKKSEKIFNLQQKK